MTTLVVLGIAISAALVAIQILALRRMEKRLSNQFADAFVVLHREIIEQRLPATPCQSQAKAQTFSAKLGLEREVSHEQPEVDHTAPPDGVAGCRLPAWKRN